MTIFLLALHFFSCNSKKKKHTSIICVERLTNYKDLKKLASNKDKWRNFGKLPNQP